MRMISAALLLVAASIPAAANAGDFDGPRAGIIVGWDGIGYHHNGIDKNFGGVAYGLATGYDFQLSKEFVLGLGLSTTFSNEGTKYNILTATPHGSIDPNNHVEVSVGHDLEIAARAGYIIGGSAMIYAKLGYASTKVHTKTVIGGILDEDSRSEGGLRLGAGGEVAITGPLNFLSEYRHTSYGNGVSRNQIFGGLSYRF
jgi:outer membrane immunogenic protein